MTASCYSPWKLRQFAHLFFAGGVFAYPTESVYGLGCDPWNYEAVFRLLKIKQRAPSKGVILIASGIDQLTPFISLRKSSDWKRLAMVRRSPTTWIVPVSEATPWWIRGGHQSVAVRITDFPPVVELCNHVGSPLVSTSANLAGHPPQRSAVSVRRSLGKQLDAVISGETGGFLLPSEIRDFYSGQVIRAG